MEKHRAEMGQISKAVVGMQLTAEQSSDILANRSDNNISETSLRHQAEHQDGTAVDGAAIDGADNDGEQRYETDGNTQDARESR